MTQTMLKQFYDLLGSASSADWLAITEDMVEDFVGHGLRDLVSLVRQYNPAKLHHFGVVEEITAQSFDASAIEMDMIISLTRDLVVATVTYNKLIRQLPYAMRGALTDIGSKHYAVKADPGGYFNEDDELLVFPVPTGAEKAYLEYINFATPVVGTNTSIADIADCRFPDSLTRAVLLYAVLQSKIREFGYARKIAKEHIDSIFVSNTAYIDSGSFTNKLSVVITHNLGYIPLIVVVDANRNKIPTIETHNAAYTIATLTFMNPQSGTWQTNTVSSGGLFGSFVSLLPTWSAITMGAIPTVPTLEADASGIVALLGAIPTFDGTTTNTLGNISVTRIQSILDTAADIVWKEQDGTDDITSDIESFLATHDSEMVREASSGAIAGVQIASEELKTEMAKLGNWGEEYKSKVSNFSAQIDAWLGRWKTYTDEDSLKISKWKEEVAHRVTVYRADVENESNRFKLLLDKAMSYLKVIELRLGLVRTLFSTGENFTYEFREINNEYLRRVLSFCGVTPQPQERR